MYDSCLFLNMKHESNLIPRETWILFIFHVKCVMLFFFLREWWSGGSLSPPPPPPITSLHVDFVMIHGEMCFASTPSSAVWRLAGKVEGCVCVQAEFLKYIILLRMHVNYTRKKYVICKQVKSDYTRLSAYQLSVVYGLWLVIWLGCHPGGATVWCPTILFAPTPPPPHHSGFMYSADADGCYKHF